MNHTHCASCPKYRWDLRNSAKEAGGWNELCHITQKKRSCHKYEYVMSHIWMSHVTCVEDSCHNREANLEESERVPRRNLAQQSWQTMHPIAFRAKNWGWEKEEEYKSDHVHCNRGERNKFAFVFCFAGTTSYGANKSWKSKKLPAKRRLRCRIDPENEPYASICVYRYRHMYTCIDVWIRKTDADAYIYVYKRMNTDME